MVNTKIIIIRHGEADGNIERVFHGHYNSNLTATGHIQAKLTSNFLIPYPIDIIYSSDLRRTVDTAGYIARLKGLEIITKKGLREVNGGKWENVPWEELPEKYPESYENWVFNTKDAKLPDGESLMELQQRINRNVNEIVKENKGKNICIVTHGTAIRSMLCLWRGLDIENMRDLPWYDNASVTIVEYTDVSYNILLEGENRHLQEFSTLAKQTWWKK